MWICELFTKCINMVLNKLEIYKVIASNERIYLIYKYNFFGILLKETKYYTICNI